MLAAIIPPGEQVLAPGGAVNSCFAPASGPCFRVHGRTCPELASKKQQILFDTPKINHLRSRPPVRAGQAPAQPMPAP